jgi:hypothetical protein
VIKNVAPDVIGTMSKRTAVTAMESKGGGVNLVSNLFVGQVKNANRPGSMYGLSFG